MTLAEAIEWLKKAHDDFDFQPFEFDNGSDNRSLAIATILNAVVKGELK